MTLVVVVVVVICVESLNVNLDRIKILNGKENNKDLMDVDVDGYTDHLDESYDAIKNTEDDEETSIDSLRKRTKHKSDVYTNKRSNKKYIIKGQTHNDEMTEEKFPQTTSTVVMSIKASSFDNLTTKVNDLTTTNIVDVKMSTDENLLKLTSENGETLTELLTTKEMMSSIDSTSLQQTSDSKTSTESSFISSTTLESITSGNFMTFTEPLTTSSQSVETLVTLPSIVTSIERQSSLITSTKDTSI